jgi:hypothetical protein
MRAIINPLPTGSRQSIELKGLKARVQTHNSFPNLYVDIDNSASDTDSEKASSPAPAVGPNGIGSAPAQKPISNSAKTGAANNKLNQPDRFKIVRLQTKKDSRVVSNVKISLLGKVSNEEDVIPTTAEPVSGGEWVKVIPSRPLVPGEYALIEMLGEKQINMYVWDFGYDPTAPANATAWKPQQPQSTETGSNETPILTKRPKWLVTEEVAGLTRLEAGIDRLIRVKILDKWNLVIPRFHSHNDGGTWLLERDIFIHLAFSRELLLVVSRIKLAFDAVVIAEFSHPEGSCCSVLTEWILPSIVSQPFPRMLR